MLGVGAPALVALAGCGAAECHTGEYPPAPSDATGVVHVAASCSGDDADGSAMHPFPTIQAGVDHAPSHGAVLVAPGTYAENVAIKKPVMVIGATPTTTAEDAPVIVEAPAPFAITVAAGSGDVLLRGLAIVEPIGVGVWMQGAGKVDVDGVRIEGAKPDSQGNYGYGGLAVDDGAFVICRSLITGSLLGGVLVSGAKGEIDRSTIAHNGGRGGIRVELGSGEVSIHDNVLDGNSEGGIGVYGSDVLIRNNVIQGTKPSGAFNIADGIIVLRSKDKNGVAHDAGVTIDGNTLKDNGRFGVLLSAGAAGAITNNHVEGNGFSAAFAAGIWAQAGAGGPGGLKISGNTISGNQYVGIGLTSGARATIAENSAVSDTKAATVFLGLDQPLIGDGIGVFDGSFAAIQGNTLQGNGRFGIILDTADQGSTLDQNTVSGSAQYGVVIQNQAMAPALGSNMLSGNTIGPSKVVMMGEQPFGVQKADFATP